MEGQWAIISAHFFSRRLDSFLRRRDSRFAAMVERFSLDLLELKMDLVELLSRGMGSPSSSSRWWSGGCAVVEEGV